MHADKLESLIEKLNNCIEKQEKMKAKIKYMKCDHNEKMSMQKV